MSKNSRGGHNAVLAMLNLLINWHNDGSLGDALSFSVLALVREYRFCFWKLEPGNIFWNMKSVH